MKNFADIMKKAQQMQQKMTDMQKELESAEVTGAAGAGMVQVCFVFIQCCQSFLLMILF